MPGPSGEEALRLAEASDWKGLQRLVERQPEAARALGDYGMLPLHWACTERRAPLALLLRLLAAYPEAARVRNAADLLPLHIAIRAGAHAAWLSRLVKAFPEAISMRTPTGETAIELAEGMQLDADRLKVLYRAERELASPEANSDNDVDMEDENQPDGEEDGGADDDDVDLNNQQELRGSRKSSRKSVSSVKKSRTSQSNDHEDEQVKGAWPSPPSPFVGNGGGVGGNRLSAATVLSDVEVIEASSISSGSELSEGAVRLSASRDHMISPSSLSTSSNQFSPPNSVSAPVPLSSALYDAAGYPRRHKSSRGQFVDREYADQPFPSSRRFDGYRDRQVKSMAPQRPSGSEVSDDRDLRSMVSTSMGGRHQSLPIIPSFETGRRNSIGAFVERSSRDLESESDDSDVNEEAHGRRQNQQYYHSQPNRHSQQYQLQPYDQQTLSSGQQQQQQQQQQAQQRRAFQTQPHPAKQRHHSPFAYRRASHGEVMLSSNGAHRRTFESPPEWRLDDECSICRVTFNMFKHRHHCRNCGKSICRQHSADKKIAMESKGFTTPQRVCITCYAMITQSRSLKHDLALDDITGEPLLNSVAFQQQHYGTPGSSVGSPAIPMGAPASAAMRSYAATTASVSTASSRRPIARSSSVAGGPSPVRNTVGLASTTLGMTTAGTSMTNGSTTMTSTMTPAVLSSATSMPMESTVRKELALLGQLDELRALVSSQQQQIEQLAQSNAQMQHQLLEQEELKAETTLLITQLMTRVSMLELRKGRDDDDEDDDADVNENKHEHEHEDEDEDNEVSIVSK